MQSGSPAYPVGAPSADRVTAPGVEDRRSTRWNHCEPHCPQAATSACGSSTRALRRADKSMTVKMAVPSTSRKRHQMNRTPKGPNGTFKTGQRVPLTGVYVDQYEVTSYHMAGGTFLRASGGRASARTGGCSERLPPPELLTRLGSHRCWARVAARAQCAHAPPCPVASIVHPLRRLVRHDDTPCILGMLGNAGKASNEWRSLRAPRRSAMSGSGPGDDENGPPPSSGWGVIRWCDHRVRQKLARRSTSLHLTITNPAPFSPLRSMVIGSPRRFPWST